MQWLLPLAGSGPTQRIVIPGAVLIFGWGALAFISAVGGKQNWWLSLPWVWMLAYGFCYETGFLNFYLSLGLCLWYLTIVWRSGWPMGLAASPLLILAWMAHPLSVLWVVGTAAYVALARNLPPRRRLIPLGLCVVVLWATRYVLMSRFLCSWSRSQTLLVSGADQLLVFGLKYLYTIVPLLLVSILLFIRLIKTCGWTELPLTLPFQLWVLSAAAVVLLPNEVHFPAYAAAFGYIANRLSLPVGIMACALLAQVPLRMYEKIAMVMIAAAFSAMLYGDTRELNRWEDSVDAQIAQLPPGQRVISALPVLSFPVDPLAHMLDRACVGRCYSYANYEPSTRQFRIRADEGNAIVLSDYADVHGVERARYVVQPRDIPLYLIYACKPLHVEACIRSVNAGELVGRRLGTEDSTDMAPAAVRAATGTNSQWDNPALRKVAAERVHRKFGADIYGTVDENYPGGPALVVHNKSATETWAKRFFTEGANSPNNEYMWLMGFRSYLVTNGADTWRMDIKEDPKYRSLFQGQSPSSKP
jgi:hypothetical protein